MCSRTWIRDRKQESDGVPSFVKESRPTRLCVLAEPMKHQIEPKSILASTQCKSKNFHRLLDNISTTPPGDLVRGDAKIGN